MAISIESFVNKPVIFPFKIAGLSFELPVNGLSCNLFYLFSSLLKAPSNELLLQVMRDDKNIKNWIKLKTQSDSSSSWTDSIIRFSISKWIDTKSMIDIKSPIDKVVRFLIGKFVDKEEIFSKIKEAYSDDLLFASIAQLNSIHHYFDSLIDPLQKDKEEDKKENKTPYDPVKGLLHVSMVCNKLGLSELNNQKISINNMFDVLTFAQYYYLTTSNSVTELITLSNLAFSPFGGELKKPDLRSNIEMNYEAFRSIMKGVVKYNGDEFREDEWLSEEAREMVSNRCNESFTKIYEFFAK